MYKKPVQNSLLSKPNSDVKKVIENGEDLFELYELMWRRKTTKLHKSWEGDALGRVRRTSLHTFLDITADGRKIASIKYDSTLLHQGSIVSANGYEFEVGAPLASSSSTTSQSAQSALNTQGSPNVSTSSLNSRPLTKSRISDKVVSCNSSIIDDRIERVRTWEKAIKPENSAKTTSELPDTIPSVKKQKLEPLKFSGSNSFFSSPFKVPSCSNGDTPIRSEPIPKINHPQDTECGRKKPIVVQEYIDKQLLDVLRPHQISGVDFIVNSVLGLRHGLGEGCILADEMGLGKTLTSIASVHTLLKGKHIKNALIVCPVTLISNWKSEFSKWLPQFRNPQFGVLAIDQNGLGNNSLKEPATSFFSDRQFKSYQVMIIGYERVRLILHQLTALSKEFDLVICDEGHRLKTSGSKTAEAIEQICGAKRVILSGTPIQNDLGEFWSLANFVNPGVFGSEAQFNRRYAVPISSEKKEDEKRDSTVAELIEICDEFMLRRDITTIEKYVNVPKTELVVFCRPSYRQSMNYQHMTSGIYADLLGDSLRSIDQSACLKAISDLKKAAAGDQADQGGKLKFLSNLLDSLREISPQEKVVIVSGSTRVLDMCQGICASKRISWLRLDGSTPQEKRQSSVNLFNKQSVAASGAFLLSSRSGGMGLNLIGGSRLVLLDCDWNPAIDAQVMGRIHRDGQKRPCFIYRLLTTGTIDEKIFQRQLSKINLSQNILMSAAMSSSTNTNSPDFSREILKDLFSFSVPTKCNTLEAARESLNIKGYVETGADVDKVLNKACEVSGNVSCLFLKQTEY